MVTSRSARKPQNCVCGIWIFSGRPDPTWRVNYNMMRKLLEIWNSLEALEGKVSPPPSLGYRGCFLKCSSDGEWIAYKGAVTKKKGDIRETRKDINRKFEKALLNSAPKATLPFHPDELT